MSTETTEINSQISKSDNRVQYLTFVMAEEEYGIEILSVREIRGWESMTAIPNTPDYVKGVINLRGTVVPIIDLRLRFSLPQADYSDVTVVVIVKIRVEQAEKVMGLVVDAVSDVYNLDPVRVRPCPDLYETKNKAFISGLIDVDDKMVVLLALDEILNV